MGEVIIWGGKSTKHKTPYHFSKELVTTIYKPFRPFGRGPTTPVRGLTITMVFWGDPPSTKLGSSHLNS